MDTLPVQHYYMRSRTRSIIIKYIDNISSNQYTSRRTCVRWRRRGCGIVGVASWVWHRGVDAGGRMWVIVFLASISMGLEHIRSSEMDVTTATQ
jgi:hypothetical protein